MVPPKGPSNVIHIVAIDNGHCPSIDCWCEPNRIFWYKNKFGILMLVVEHNDETRKHRIVVISERERDRLSNNGTDLDSPWITRALESFQTPLLPPM